MPVSDMTLRRYLLDVNLLVMALGDVSGDCINAGAQGLPTDVSERLDRLGGNINEMRRNRALLELGARRIQVPFGKIEDVIASIRGGEYEAARREATRLFDEECEINYARVVGSRGSQEYW